MPIHTCIICNSEFNIPQWRLNGGRKGLYCSAQCRIKGQVGANAAHYKGGKLTMECQVCGTEFSYLRAVKGRRKFCSKDCKYMWMHLALSGENSKMYKDGRAMIGENKHSTYEYRQWRRTLLDTYKYCNKCGDTSDLEVDHILPLFIYPEKAYDITNGQVLCEPCHKLKTAQDSKDIANHRTILNNAKRSIQFR